MTLITRLLLLALCVSSSAFGAAGDKFIGNENSGKVLNIFTTTSGNAVTIAATVDATQQWTIGAASSNIHTFKGFIDVSGTTAATPSGSGAYVYKNSSNGLTLSDFQISFESGSAGSRVITGNVGATTGAWVFGASGGSQTHTFNGNILGVLSTGANLTLKGAAKAASASFGGITGLDSSGNQQGFITFAADASNNAQITIGADGRNNGTTSSNISFLTANSGTLGGAGTVSNLGAWTLGASGGSQTHTVNGALNVTGTINRTSGSISLVASTPATIFTHSGGQGTYLVTATLTSAGVAAYNASAIYVCNSSCAIFNAASAGNLTLTLSGAAAFQLTSTANQTPHWAVTQLGL